MFTQEPEGFDRAMDVVGVFVMHEGTCLLLKRHPSKSSGDTWGLPAGKVEPGEEIKAAALRELWEESSIKANQLEYLGKHFVTGAPAGGIIYHQFKLDLPSRPPVHIREDESTEFRWVTVTEALKLPLVHDLDLCFNEYFL